MWPQCCGYPGIPGLFTTSQLAGWKRVTEVVHAKGGRIYCQIWHVGRATVPALIEGNQTVSSSDIPITGKAVDGSEYSAYPPRPMTVEEIKEVTAEFAAAAKRCIDIAGFDGVELHGYAFCILPKISITDSHETVPMDISSSNSSTTTSTSVPSIRRIG